MSTMPWLIGERGGRMVALIPKVTAAAVAAAAGEEKYPPALAPPPPLPKATKEERDTSPLAPANDGDDCKVEKRPPPPPAAAEAAAAAALCFWCHSRRTSRKKERFCPPKLTSKATWQPASRFRLKCAVAGATATSSGALAAISSDAVCNCRAADDEFGDVLLLLL